MLAVVLLAALVVKPHALHVLGQGEPGNQKLFFLFMANGTVHHDFLWNAFFSDAIRGTDYEALLHCQQDCHENVQKFGHNHFQPIIIPTVDSAYCTNLVTPMVALMKAALQLPASKSPEVDKFLFVSDSTLPAKPFWVVSSTIGYAPSSRFCLLPDTAPMLKPHHGDWFKVKTSQWFTATRSHGQKMVTTLGTFPHGFRLSWNGDGLGCSDEFFPFESIFGQVQHPESLPDCSPTQWEMSRCPEAMTNYFKDLKLTCDTFTSFSFADVTMPPNIRSAVASQNFVHTEFGFQANLSHPATIREFSPTSLDLWRATPYLFMRKIGKDVTFVATERETDFGTAFIKHVLSEGAGHL